MKIVPLSELNDINELRGLVGFLYDILDDIDTEDDVCKSNDKKYRERVQKHHLKRTVRIQSDGYNLFVNTEPQAGFNNWMPSGGHLVKAQTS